MAWLDLRAEIGAEFAEHYDHERVDVYVLGPGERERRRVVWRESKRRHYKPRARARRPRAELRRDAALERGWAAAWRACAEQKLEAWWAGDRIDAPEAALEEARGYG